MRILLLVLLSFFVCSVGFSQEELSDKEAQKAAKAQDKQALKDAKEQDKAAAKADKEARKAAKKNKGSESTEEIDDNVGDSRRSQRHQDLKAKKALKLANKLADKGSYYNAVLYYQDVYSKKPNKDFVVYQLATLNRELRDYRQSEKWYRKLLEMEVEDDYPKSRFYYAKMMKMNGKYEDAKVEFMKFASEYEEEEDRQKFKALAKREATGCDVALRAIENPVVGHFVEVLPKGLNNPLQDFAPQPVEDNIVLFSALKGDTAMNVDKQKEYRSRLFTIERMESGWQNEQEFGLDIVNEKAHFGNGILTDDGKTLYYTKCEESELIQEMICQIYFITKENDSTWSKPQLVKGINSRDANTTQPSMGLSVDGKKILFFSSDRSGGAGGMDIWYAIEEENGVFDRPVNLGRDYNTAGNEMTPHYNLKREVLYFSSDGWPTIGGLDIFKLEGNVHEWTDTVTNMGYPINSSSDDLYLSLNEKGAEGYMVSNRIGTTSPRGETCCDDIFGVTIDIPVYLYLKGYYTSKRDPERKPISGVEAGLYKVDGSSFEFIGDRITSDDSMFHFKLEPGVEYKMNGNKEGYWPSVDNITTPAVLEESDTIFQVFYIEEIIKKKIIVKNVYFAFDKDSVRQFYRNRMDSLYDVMVDNPEYLLEISGHTDSKGSNAYNMKLSKKRADAALDYMLDRGMDEDRMVVKWFGEERPIAENEFPDGSDNPIGRAKNRRVEFKIVHDDETTIDYSDEGPLTTE